MVLKLGSVLDHKLANFLFNLDNKFKFKIIKLGGFLNLCFKKKLKNTLPQKNSVPDPQSEWLKSDLKEFLWMSFQAYHLKKSEMFNKKIFSKILIYFIKIN